MDQTDAPIPISSGDPIQARHLAWLAEAGAMTMSLIRKTHACAEAQLESSEPEASKAKTPDYALRFTGLVNALQRLIAAEARAAAGTLTSSPAPTRASAAKAPLAQTASKSDPRYTLIRTALHQAVRTDPDRAKLRRAIDQELDRDLTADPAHTIPIGLVLAAVADRLDIRLDVTRLPDALLVIELPTDPPNTTRPPA